MRAWAGGGSATVLVLAAARGAAAQERPGAVYVLGGVTMTHQDGAADGESQIYITAPGGTTAGWTVGGGVFVARQRQRRRGMVVVGDDDRQGARALRDDVHRGAARSDARGDGQDSHAARRQHRHRTSGGWPAVAHDRWSTTETSRPWLPPGEAVEVGPRIRYDTVTGAAFVGGVDLRIGSGRAAVVPGFRVRAVTRGEDLVAYYPGGFPRWTVGGGVTVRVGFYETRALWRF